MVDAVFGFPTYRGEVNVRHLGSYDQARCAKNKNARVLGYTFAEGVIVEHARNLLVWTAMQNKADWLIMADADTVAPDGTALVEMVAEGQARRAAVIAAPCKGRLHSAWCMVGLDGQVVEDARVFFGQVVEVSRIGTGIMAVNLGWLREHWPESPWFSSTLTHSEKGPQKLGEDYGFCNSVRLRGGAVYCDGRVVTVHAH